MMFKIFPIINLLFSSYYFNLVYKFIRNHSKLQAITYTL